MVTRKPAPRAVAKRRPRNAKKQSPHDDVWLRTRQLVEVLLQVMEREIQSDEPERSEQWLRLFGAKDSAVVNLQKLVQLLAELQQGQPVPSISDTAAMDDEEMKLLRAWLADASAVNASPAT